MKSRFLLHSQLPVAPTNTPQRPKISSARRFELKYNASPNFARRRKQRREGQALLLAVLIMLLAALLSAGVLAVVSGNLNQTARIADKTRAIEASRAGIAYANTQLSGSAQGDLWRPVDVSPAPVQTDNNYNTYYSQLDKVQGWANTLPITDPNYRNTAYAKFPAPDQPIGDAPKFLVRVQEIPLTLPANDPNIGHEGQIKITSIGLSDDDPNVFSTSVAYKEGRRKSPWSQALRSVSNWDFKNNLVPQGRVSTVVPDATTGTTKVTVINTALQGTFPEAPFNIVLSHKDTTPANSLTFGGVVTAVAAPAVGTTEYTVAGVAPNGFVANDTLQVAAALGTARTIDLLNTGAVPSPANPLTFPSQNQPSGILANGSLWLQGQYQLTALQKIGSKVRSSGAMFLSGTTSVPTARSVPVSGEVTTAGDLAPSSAIGFPGDFVASSGVKTDLVNDAWDKLNSMKTLGLDFSDSTVQKRVVEPFTPAKIDSAQNLARYRALTRNADAEVINGVSYQKGVYIDNRDDVEKIYNTATSRNEPMTQAQLVNLLVSPDSATIADYSRKGTAALDSVTTATLEQRHLRGWVGSDEFLARGALVEICPSTPTNPGPNAPNPFIRVTYDARSDGNPVGPDANKTMRDANGNTQTGIYTKELVWPRNGTLFAEGNIRIRGSVQLPAAPTDGTVDLYPSLTVVSMNNIYIEGSVSVDNTLTGAVPAVDRKKLMLMAKKNVIVNPTRAVLARTDAQTVASNTGTVTLLGIPGTAITPATAAPFSIQVKDTGVFNRGDYVEIVGSALTTPVRGLITTIAGNQLTISSTAAGVIPPSTLIAPVIVRSPLEKRQAVTVITNPLGPNPTATNTEFFSLVDTENAINRRLVAPILRQSTTNNKLLFDHVGELKQTSGVNDGLRVKAEDASIIAPRPAGFTAELTNKQMLYDATQNNDFREKSITDVNKKLRIYNNLTAATDKDEFSASATKNLTQFATEISAIPHINPGPPPTGYKYTSSATSPTVGALPSFALTGIGLRYAPGSYFDPLPTDPKNNRRQDINNKEFIVPLATSIEFDLNSALSDLGVVGETRAVSHIGFNPVFGTSDDALTIDSNFYQLPTAILNSTLDARNITLGAAAGATTRVNFPQSIVLKRAIKYGDKAPLAADFLPAYKVRSIKMENYDSGNDDIQIAGDIMQINAFVYAQEGSWLVIPGDYFRTNPPIRGERNPTTGALIGSYIDYNDNKLPDAPAVGKATEYVLNGAGRKAADLNRNGKDDTGEFEAALQYVRQNTVQIEFYGAIVENQTAVVADIANPTVGAPPLVKGAVQDWMDKWASYSDVGLIFPNVGRPNLFKFINYAYDPSLANGTVGANQLRVPVTDDLIYEE